MKFGSPDFKPVTRVIEAVNNTFVVPALRASTGYKNAAHFYAAYLQRYMPMEISDGKELLFLYSGIMLDFG